MSKKAFADADVLGRGLHSKMVSNVVRLDDQAVIVTGAGSGIGRGMALAFASAGADVVVADIQTNGANQTRALIADAGGSAIVVQADVADEESVVRMVEAAMSRWGRVDVLCNNAGVMDRMQPAADVTTTMWQRTLQINLTGAFFGTRAVLPHMLAAERGVIINTASEASLRGGAGGAAYTAAKHGLIGLTRNVAWSYGKRGIRCNAICPGGVYTNIAGDAAMTDEATRFAAFDQLGLELYSPVLALAGRIASPENIASAAIFLASELASFINGAVVPVDDGWSAA